MRIIVVVVEGVLMEFFGQFFLACKCSNYEEIALKYKYIMYRLQ